ncbi:TIGR03084 family metal-binding protein [Nocardia gamkensis]|uniref:TIGR03084 family metal-binding protein n=1 Tax=Nocardia gamkensis TaxID=352869 RepID=UPI0033C11646
MALDFPALLRDLEQESDLLRDYLFALAPDVWNTATPAEGWAIRDQVSHLAFFDDFALLAMTDPDRFRAEAAALTAPGPDFPDRVAAEYREMTPTSLLTWFADSRAALVAAFAEQDPRRRLPWFGPDMSVASSATARLMETWAHGQDIYDTLGVPHPPGAGLRGIAHLGVATFGFAFTLNGLAIPSEPVHVALHSPDDELWTWGPDDAVNRVIGPAEDFVLVATQRRHRDDTDLSIQGEIAESWMRIAQAYAGAPGTGRRAAQRRNPR